MPFDGFPAGLDLLSLPGIGWQGFPDLSEAAWLRPLPDLPARLERDRDPGPVALGAEADPYQPVERSLALTRQVLEALERSGRPVTLVTRSVQVLRDRDILARLARRGLLRACVAVSTLDPALARRLEPRAAAPALRLATIGALAASGIPVGVLVAPVIPGVNDLEVEHVLAAAAAAGATLAGFGTLHPPAAARPAVEAWVQAQLPHRPAQMLARLRQVRAASGSAGTLAERFQAATARLGLNRPDAADVGASDRSQPEPRQHQPRPVLAAA